MYGTYATNVQCIRIFCYAVPHNNRYTLLTENIIFYFVIIHYFYFFSSSNALPHTFVSERDCTPRQRYISIARDWKTNTRSFKSFAGLQKIKFEGTGHSLCICYVCVRSIFMSMNIYRHNRFQPCSKEVSLQETTVFACQSFVKQLFFLCDVNLNPD